VEPYHDTRHVSVIYYLWHETTVRRTLCRSINPACMTEDYDFAARICMIIHRRRSMNRFRSTSVDQVGDEAKHLSLYVYLQYSCLRVV